MSIILKINHLGDVHFFRKYKIESGEILLGRNKMQIAAKMSKSELAKDSTVSFPNSIYATKIFGKLAEPDSGYYVSSSGNTLMKLWQNQHPLIHTWLLLSSVSICLLFTVFFVIQ